MSAADGVAMFSTRSLARGAIRIDELDPKMWRASKDVDAWVISTKAGRRARWSDVPKSAEKAGVL